MKKREQARESGPAPAKLTMPFAKKACLLGSSCTTVSSFLLCPEEVHHLLSRSASPLFRAGVGFPEEEEEEEKRK